MIMTREQVIEELQTIKAYFEEESGATPICIDEAIRYLREGSGSDAERAPKHVYFFDCLDAFIGEKYLTAEDLAELLTGKREPMQEKEIIATAKDYEATLYRYELDGSGTPCNGTMIYDCMY